MHVIDIASSILSFAGATVSSIDALFAPRRIRTEAGARRFSEALKRIGAGTVLEDEQGNSLRSETALGLWLVKETLHWSWFGFALMALGFVLDLISNVKKG